MACGDNDMQHHGDGQPRDGGAWDVSGATSVSGTPRSPLTKASAYAQMSAHEAFLLYRSRYRMLQAGYITLIVLCGIAAIAALGAHELAAYLFCLLLIGVLFVLFNVVMSGRFRELQGILYNDCDVEKYRQVMERFGAQWKRRSTQATVALELAFCAFEAGDAAAALEALSRLDGKRRVAIQQVRALNIRAFCCDDLGDSAGRDAAVSELRTLAAGGLRSKKLATEVSRLLRALDIAFMDHQAWSPDDAAFMRDGLAAAQLHVNRVGWCLRLAEYESLHGDAARARAYLDENLLEPLTPRARRLRDELLSKLPCVQEHHKI